MHRYERWFIVGLVALVVLIVALVIAVPITSLIASLVARWVVRRESAKSVRARNQD